MWRGSLWQACLPFLVSIWAAGCAASGSSRMRDLDSSVTLSGPINGRESFPAENGKNITLASWKTPSCSAELPVSNETFPANKELTAELLVEQVLARNPSLAEM